MSSCQIACSALESKSICLTICHLTGACIFINYAVCRYLEERLAEQELDAHERDLEKQKEGQENVAAAENDDVVGAAEAVAA